MKVNENIKIIYSSIQILFIEYTIIFKDKQVKFNFTPLVISVKNLTLGIIT